MAPTAHTHRLVPFRQPGRGHKGSVLSVAFGRLRDDLVLASASADRTLRLWSVQTGLELLPPLIGHTNSVRSVKFGEIDGRVVLVSGSYDHTVRIWNADSGEPVGDPLEAHQASIYTVNFGVVDGQPTIASGSADGMILLWDPYSPDQPKARIDGHQDLVRALRFVEIDGTPILASAGYDYTVRLWDARTSEEVCRPLEGHTNAVYALAFGRVGGRLVLASGGADNIVRLWDPSDGRPLEPEMVGHTDAIRSISFITTNGEDLIVTGSADNSVRLWRPTTGEQIGDPIDDHSGTVYCVASVQDQDGEPIVATSSHDQTIRVWCSSPPIAEYVPLVADRPALTDGLNRQPAAAFLATRIAALVSEPGSSVAVHISGPWGMGKTSLTNFVLQELADRHATDYVLPDAYFSAWRGSKVGPAWWAFLNYVRQVVRSQQGSRFARVKFTMSELTLKLRRSVGFMTPLLTVTGLVLGALVVNWLRPADSVEGVVASVEWVSAIVAGLGSLAASGLIASRFLLWQSPSGAALFQRTDSNPMGEVARHFLWLRRQLKGRPLIIVIDDLDRCDAAYVVEFLEVLQTLVRQEKAHGAAWRDGGGAEDSPLSSLAMVVAADARWLQAAYGSVFSDFAKEVPHPGTTVGHLFTAKIFDLHLRLPSIEGSQIAGFGREKLGVADETYAGVRLRDQEGHATPGPSTFDVSRALEILSDRVTLDGKARVVRQAAELGASPEDQSRLGVALASEIGSDENQRYIEHQLEPYLDIISPNPRAIVRYVNSISIEQILNSTRRDAASFSEMARWTAIRQRWPLAARRLRADPELVEKLGTRSALKGRQDPLAGVLDSIDLAHAAGRHDPETMLTPAGIRRCCALLGYEVSPKL